MRHRGGPGAVGAATALAVGASGCAAQGALDPSGDEARDVALLWWGMLAAGAAVFVLVVVLLVLAGRPRRDVAGVAGTDADGGPGGAGAPDGPGPMPTDADISPRSRRLVLGGGILLPIVVLVPLTVAMLVVASRTSNRVGPVDVAVEVTGHQYWWEVRYPGTDVVTANEVHVPVDRDVVVTLNTADVIHSFWVPPLAGKVDMIPGQTTELRFRAEEAGEYLGYCAEFCGIQHARMRFLVIAQPVEEFEQWLTQQATDAVPPATDAARRGQEVFATAGCAACHAVRGTEAVGVLGPDLTHVATRRTLGAATVPNGRGQLAGWIADPQGVKPGNLMPPSPLDADELADVLAYVEGLR